MFSAHALRPPSYGFDTTRRGAVTPGLAGLLTSGWNYCATGLGGRQAGVPGPLANIWLGVEVLRSDASVVKVGHSLALENSGSVVGALVKFSKHRKTQTVDDMKKKAKIVRMVTPGHLCPWGIKALDLLRRHGYEIHDQHLESMDANEEYKDRHGYGETPQIWIGDEHLGGYDQLREHFDLGPDPKEGDTYQPVVAVFAVALLMALSSCWAMQGELGIIRVAELFIAISMCVLGILKLQDLKSFATGFVQYDLLARRYVPYSNVYPMIEAIGGALMIGGLFTWAVAPQVLIVSTIGAISVVKAVYIEKRDLKCACVGGGSSVPLGFISLVENLLMMTMSVWMMVSSP